MLKTLIIQDFILVESLQIDFESGLNILTGETGSGKSVILEALMLALGARGDNQMIRSGAKKAIIEAEFDISFCPLVSDLLAKYEIEQDDGEFLKIRRELAITGKNRCFINFQMIQTALLKEIGKYLVNIVSQHANQQLLESLSHRDFLDSYAGLQKKTAALTKIWDVKSHLHSQIQTLKDNEAMRLREKDRCLMEIEELEAANVANNEEEELFTHYQVLSKSEEITIKLQEIIHFINEGKTPFSSQLKRQRNLLQQLAHIDPGLCTVSENFETLCIELDDVLYTLQNYSSKLEHNPQKLAKINERLSLIHRLKKKYGPDPKKYLNTIIQKIHELEQSDLILIELQTSLEQKQSEFDSLAQAISLERRQAAELFEQEVIVHLSSLNMGQAQFQISISTQSPNTKGYDHVQFLLAPNKGENFFAVQDYASGGELARLMLAIKSVIASKEQYPTIVFDEIDANLGGETATNVGEKLDIIGQQRQVLCITHLPQVALKAHHHFKIFKEEKNGRTITQIKVLDSTLRQAEITRMLGGVNMIKEYIET